MSDPKPSKPSEARLHAALKGIEWSANAHKTVCPSCHWRKPVDAKPEDAEKYHSPDCDLASLLRLLR